MRAFNRKDCGGVWSSRYFGLFSFILYEYSFVKAVTKPVNNRPNRNNPNGLCLVSEDEITNAIIEGTIIIAKVIIVYLSLRIFNIF